MDRDLLIKYLKHLDGLLATVEQKQAVHFHDIAPLRSEFAGFRTRISKTDFLTLSQKELLGSVDIKVDDKNLEGSPKTKMMTLVATAIRSSPLIQGWRARNKEIVDGEISRLRSELLDLVRVVAP